jgi:2'-5' RNA ligase
MRMFVAVRPPEEVLDGLADFVEPRRESGSPLRWAPPGQWHVTLAFLPQVSDRHQEPLAERLRDTAAAATGFELALAGAGAFPDPARARVLWAGVDGELERLGRLARTVRSACGRAGTEVQGGEFRPHLTLARLNTPIDVTRWLRVFQLLRSEPWWVGELLLVESQLGSGPARHRVVEEFALSAG